MTAAGFILNPVSQQPGAWMSPNGIPVDLMVPEHLAGSGSRRGVRIPPPPSTLHGGRPDWRRRSSTSHR